MVAACKRDAVCAFKIYLSFLYSLRLAPKSVEGAFYGSADFSGGWGWCQEYSVASLNMKNLMSPTPRNWVLNALILALKDSADALVSLRSK